MKRGLAAEKEKKLTSYFLGGVPKVLVLEGEMCKKKKSDRESRFLPSSFCSRSKTSVDVI